MGFIDTIRKTLKRADDRPVVTTIVTLVVIVVCSVYIVWSCTRRPVPELKISNKYYYCDEDGTNVFIDEASNVPPFQHNGKTAVRAVIFKCVDGTGAVITPPFVQRVEKYDDETRKSIEEEIAKGSPGLPAQNSRFTGLMIKKPGDANWVQMSDSAAWGEVIKATCPNGGSIVPVSVDENAHPK